MTTRISKLSWPSLSSSIDEFSEMEVLHIVGQGIEDEKWPRFFSRGLTIRQYHDLCRTAKLPTRQRTDLRKKFTQATVLG